MATRRELIEAVAARYRAGGRSDKKDILDEFVKGLRRSPEMGSPAISVQVKGCFVASR